MLSTGYRNSCFIFSFAAFVLVYASCKSTKTVTTTPDKAPDKPTTTAPVKEDESVPVNADPVKFNVVLVMPFELKENFRTDVEEVLEPEVKQSSLPALSFYEGAVIAVDSMNAKGKEVKLNAFETPSDSAGISKMFSNQVLKDAELVIATFPNSLVTVAASIANKHGINLILTQASSPDFLEGKKNVALAYPSTVTQCKEVVATMITKNPAANILLIYRKVKRENELADFFRSGINEHKGSSDFKEINATELSGTEITKHLSKTRRNIVFIVSSDEAFISPLLVLIEEQNIYGIQLVGLPTWLNFESIDFMALKNIQVIIFENNFVNYDDSDRIYFRKNFINRYHTDPLTSAYNGFDLVYNIGNQAANVKVGLHKMIEKSFDKSNQNFSFKHFNSGGMENQKISILRFNDYRLEVVPLD